MRLTSIQNAKTETRLEDKFLSLERPLMHNQTNQSFSLVEIAPSCDNVNSVLPHKFPKLCEMETNKLRFSY